MTVAINDIIDKAEIVLQDTTNVRWAAAELLGWANDGIAEIIREKPGANTTNESVAMVAGTKQTLPTGGILLINITRNTGTNGTTYGNAIRLVDHKILDSQVPDWHLTSGAAAVIKHYTFDPRDPKVYYVYPPSDATTQIEIVYSSVLAPIAAGANIGLGDEYRNCILDYILYRAYTKDADYASNSERAIGHYQAFLMALGSSDKAQALFNPNRGFVLRDKLKHEQNVETPKGA